GSFFRWKGGIANKKFKIVFTIIIVIGITTSLLGFESLEIIMLAQALNGMILPIISILMLIIVNKKSLLKNHTNGLLLNIIGFIVVAIVTALGFYSMYSGITGLFDIKDNYIKLSVLDLVLTRYFSIISLVILFINLALNQKH